MLEALTESIESMHSLRLENVSHRFNDAFAVDGVSVTVDAGEIVCLLGPSGCGKTTLLRLAAGLEHVQVGRVSIGERVVAEGGASRQVPPEQRGVGLMFQDFALFPHLTVIENICFGVPQNDRARQKWVRAALEDVGLSHVAERYPHTLSGGQQQRIALLRALAPAPGVMLLDEPFSGLDEHLRQQVRQETLSILTDAVVATLMVTHDPEEAMYLADRIVVLNAGRIVQDAPPLDLYNHPQEPFVARLFGPVNEFHGRVRDGRVQTLLGPVPAPNIDDGADALVMVRAHGIQLLWNGAGSAPQPSVSARVRSARPLGPTTQVLLEPLRQATDNTEQLLEARVSDLLPPEPGTELHLRPDPAQVFVFDSNGE